MQDIDPQRQYRRIAAPTAGARPALLTADNWRQLRQTVCDVLLPPAAYLLLCAAVWQGYLPKPIVLLVCVGGVALLASGTWLPRRRVQSVAYSASVAFVVIIFLWLFG